MRSFSAFPLAVAVAFQIPSAYQALDTRMVAATVEAVAAAVAREYFDEAQGVRVAAQLRARHAAGAYERIQSLDTLAYELTRDMQAVTTDKHLVVTVRANATRSIVSERPETLRARTARNANGGVREARILNDNVGYLDISFFFRPVEARGAIARAMTTLREADALIIDMRRNGGGSPETVVMVMSYLIDEKVPLFDLIPRTGSPRRYSIDSVPVKSNGERPIFVLTSSRTFSGGEGLAFLLQERRRAVIVGERTAGAANPGEVHSVSEFFEITIPNARLVSAVRRSTWEGSGVTPDISASADDALRVAIERTRVAIRGKS